MTEELDNTSVEEQLEWYAQGYLTGFDAGISIGRDQGYEDCLYRIKRMAENIYDPDLEKAIKILTGEE